MQEMPQQENKKSEKHVFFGSDARDVLDALGLVHLDRVTGITIWMDMEDITRITVEMVPTRNEVLEISKRLVRNYKLVKDEEKTVEA